MASQAGWGRLAEDLRAAGFEVTVTERPYAQERYGRIEHGVSRSITFQVKDGDRFLGCVDVNDKHGRMGKWYGWTVIASGPDSIVVGRPTWAVTKRSEIVGHFKTAVATLTSREA